jgi:tetratricopeptide (TPR) repeat protein
MVSTGRANGQRLTVAEALDLYAKGEFEQAVEGRPFDDLNVVTAIAALEAWIGPVDLTTATPEQRAEHARRERVAARLAIDVTAHRAFSWITVVMPMSDGQPMPTSYTYQTAANDWSPPFEEQRFNAPMVAWACARMPKAGPVEPWEAGWWLASIAILQEAGEWDVLQGGRRSSYTRSPPPWQRAVHREQVGAGHLAEARERLGPHPRVRLAEAVTRAATLTDGRQISEVIARGRLDVLRHLEEAARRVNSRAFADSERDFEALLSEPVFEAEVSLRLAQLRLLRRDWPAALRWLDRASSATEGLVYLATADYFRGWIFERTDRPAEALAAYRAAHARHDTSPNLNTLLASQLMMAGERAEAARVLERAMREQHNHTWLDLWWLLVEGDARRAGQYARQMREAQ